MQLQLNTLLPTLPSITANASYKTPPRALNNICQGMAMLSQLTPDILPTMARTRALAPTTCMTVGACMQSTSRSA